MNIKNLNKRYKVVHVSMGLNHIAAIVHDSILDLIDSSSKPSKNVVVSLF